MTRDEIRQKLVGLLADVAPELQPDALRDEVELREQLDLDSFDFLRFLVSVEKQLGVSVRESDYREVQTLAGCVDYVARRREVQAGAAHP